MNETNTSIFNDDGRDQEDIEAGARALQMLRKIMEVLKTEVEHEGAGPAMSPSDLLHKIIGLAQQYDLPEIREMALAYQEGGRRG